MWRYEQDTGALFNPLGERVGQGYSGRKGPGRNNPEYEHARSYGPIPRGLYSIGRAYKHPRLGVCSMELVPRGHNALGRTQFLIHGDNAGGDASRGCIILPRDLRYSVSNSGDRLLFVFTGDYVFEPIDGSLA